VNCATKAEGGIDPGPCQFSSTPLVLCRSGLGGGLLRTNRHQWSVNQEIAYMVKAYLSSYLSKDCVSSDRESPVSGD
jgi:hypothetical protein